MTTAVDNKLLFNLVTILKKLYEVQLLNKKIFQKNITDFEMLKKWKIIFFVFRKMRCAKKYEIISI